MTELVKKYYKKYRSLIMAGIVETVCWILNQIPASWHMTEGEIIIVAIMTYYFFELKEDIYSIEENQK